MWRRLPWKIHLGASWKGPRTRGRGLGAEDSVLALERIFKGLAFRFELFALRLKVVQALVLLVESLSCLVLAPEETTGVWIARGLAPGNCGEWKQQEEKTQFHSGKGI